MYIPISNALFRISTGPEYLWRIPFGLYFYAEDGIPPFKIDDWTTRVTFGILSEEEVEQVEYEVFTRG